MYDYREEMKQDVRQWVEDNAEFNNDYEDFTDREDFTEWLYDELFVADSVTGNASGSYTCSSYEASENLIGNGNLLIEAIEAFGDEANEYKRCMKSSEIADVTIRCYLLGEVIEETTDELIEEGVKLWQQD